MINLQKVKPVCKSYQEIPHYEEAVASTEMWCCHHLLGEVHSKEYLIEHGLYYDRPANEFVFVSKIEHNKIHHTGKTRSAETCRRISEGQRGKIISKESSQKTAAGLKKYYAEHPEAAERRREQLRQAARLRWQRRKECQSSNL